MDIIRVWSYGMVLLEDDSTVKASVKADWP